VTIATEESKMTEESGSEILVRRILLDGEAVTDEIINFSAFLNHHLDVRLLEGIGKEFRRRFDDIADKVNMILTVEASGIAIATLAATFFDYVPVLIAKKDLPDSIRGGYYFTDISSLRDRTLTAIKVEKKYLGEGDRCLLIDDVCARGEDILGLWHLAREAGAEVLGAGVAIEKEFQGGGKKLRDRGIRVESLAVVTKIEDGHIHVRRQGQ